MSLSFIPIRSEKDIKYLSEMANEIWHGFWPAIIGIDQTEYMLKRLLSPEAVKKDIEENGYEYWFLVSRELDDKGNEHLRAAGFTAGKMEIDSNRFFISKIYLFSQQRGKGYGRKVIEFYQSLSFIRGLSAIYLNVNKRNEVALAAYKKTGFSITESVEIDIGEGFILDDYVMEKRLDN